MNFRGRKFVNLFVCFAVSWMMGNTPAFADRFPRLLLTQDPCHSILLNSVVGMTEHQQIAAEFIAEIFEGQKPLHYPRLLLIQDEAQRMIEAPDQFLNAYLDRLAVGGMVIFDLPQNQWVKDTNGKIQKFEHWIYQQMQDEIGFEFERLDSANQAWIRVHSRIQKRFPKLEKTKNSFWLDRTI
jgi:hypothetical protein